MNFTISKRFIGIIFGILVILLTPLIAMLFTQEVNWSLLDFFVAGVLLVTTGVGVELIIQNIKKTNAQFVLILAVLLLLILIWLELAIGIFN